MVSARNPYKWLLDQKKEREKHQLEHAALAETNALEECIHKVCCVIVVALSPNNLQTCCNVK